MKLKNKMTKTFKYVLIIFFLLNSHSFAKEDFFAKAKNLFDNEKYEESKFLFQRNIVFNPKDSKSYLYLAKIYKTEENEREEEKNINTALLLEPNNEEALYMLIDLKLKRSDYNRVKELTEKFEIICSSLCDKIDLINERLTNIEAKDES
jgi:tetratricopeptide (TPR) repeat protein|tara:strand:+ start:3241 stop:3690 length:450 start_codon:yes stop_codon:yes gene_type:complete